MVSHLDATNNNGIWKKTAFCGCCRVPGIVWGAQEGDFSDDQLRFVGIEPNRKKPSSAAIAWCQALCGARRKAIFDGDLNSSNVDAIWKKAAFCGCCRVVGIVWGAQEGDF